MLAGLGGAALGAAVGIAAWEGGKYLIRNAGYGYIPYGPMQTPYFFSDAYANTYYTSVSVEGRYESQDAQLNFMCFFYQMAFGYTNFASLHKF
jgi:hypothetical protein